MTDSAFIIAAFIHFTGSFIMFVELSIFGCKYRKYKKHSNNKDTIWALIFVVMCNIFYALQNGVSGAFLIMHGEVNDNVATFLLMSGKVICFDCGLICVYCFLLNMLYYQFRNTRHAISLPLFIIFVAAVMFCAMRPITTLVMVVYNLCQGTYYLKDSETYLNIISISSLLVFDWLFSIVLLVLFIHKLCKRGDAEAENYALQKQRMNDLSGYVHLKQNFEKAIDDISIKASRVFILGIFLMITTQTEFITSLFAWINLQNLDWQTVSFGMDFICAMTQPLLLMLSFSFMDSWYKCCCNSCDHCVKDFCTTKLTKDVDTELQHDLIVSQ